MTTYIHPVELLKAIHRAEYDALQALIDNGADINAQSDTWSPAMQACSDGRIEALRIVIAAGADLDASGERGITPLMAAAESEEEACLALLIKTGVDLDKQDDEGHSAVWYAAAYASQNCLARLLKAGADIRECLNLPFQPEISAALSAEYARREQIALKQTLPKSKLAAKSPSL